METILDNFRLNGEKEDFEKVIGSIDSGVEFKGTNLWILVFAIFIASLGLNVNSTAVVIGAMLVSPLMGPIMGLGLGMAINDLALLKKAVFNYVFAIVVGLATSTLFFSLSPLNDASSEILARTAPNIYDVLIALFGGLAGILAVSSRKKANVIPGVAIATALMPPLCTAGYGIANLNFTYFSGALYLFLINTVFIALATLVTARFLNFPYKHLPEERDEIMAKRVVWGVVILTILPSIYFGYDIVHQNRFRQRANKFVDAEAVFPNDYLLKKTIDAKTHEIKLTYGGEFIPDEKIEELRAKLPVYDLDGATLEIKNGFAYGKNGEENEQEKQLANALSQKERELNALKEKVAASDAQKAFGKQVFEELKVQVPSISSCVLQQATNSSESEQSPIWVAVISSKEKLDDKQKERLEKFLNVRIRPNRLLLYFQVDDAPQVVR